MIVPPYLKTNDKVALIAPAKVVDQEATFSFLDYYKLKGLEVKIGKHVTEQWDLFAGNDSQRLEDLQQAMDDPDIKALFCARGGYGTSRIIDQLDFSGMLKSPKWLVGFSDITYLLGQLQRDGIASVHGPMPSFFDSSNQDSLASFDKLFDLLTGRLSAYHVAGHHENIIGNAEGYLAGGNLSILSSSLGTLSQFNYKEAILFVEEVGEPLYAIDRMFRHLLRAGVFNPVKGVIIGQFTDIKPAAKPFPVDFYGLVKGYFTTLGIPVAFGFPSGHEALNLPLPIGKKVQLKVDADSTLLQWVK
jgi:muramoyltetrapeptide carboxypeptidase